MPDLIFLLPIAITHCFYSNNIIVVFPNQALVVQHVDVCMFSNGKFKNVVALVKGSDVVLPGQTHTDTYTLTPHRGKTHFNITYCLRV